ncbi:Predicted oxidoreductase, contains short-chain dehydrogenase (SDR) and DUF2520 domains [Fodinibius roseus]|uniref:Predicted oxidoreductase, contains short-chain dehydrogenase (SDR) and DUF2520 domains n=1 Tax=Fodinibius roseus TaxID=1194090 RepID=A0A1M5BKK3_9BACT|nr:Rossmann-like and DUF2520 domain-containing protein [Fodinibius roseus]SHF42732.1 Predicted oxidoreductase, contains short-chain dehydrogenase (SDR) and DUF2520 domains [Fodinibius roseus]
MNISDIEITVIGLGALGTALTEAFASHNIKIKSVFNRNEQRAGTVAVTQKVATASSFPSELDQLGEVVFLTVTDAAIAGVAARLSALGGDLSGKTFVHCSGNESAALLDPLKEKGARTTSMHPLQTFNARSGASDFKDIYFSLQGDAAVFPLLERMAHLLGAETLSVTEEQKSHLHVAAVLASNYLITLLDAATDTGGLSGLDKKQVREALYPLIGTTLKNVQSTSFKEAISGPIVRGDVETVTRHLQLLRNQQGLLGLYTVLGQQTADRAEEAGRLDRASADELRSHFTETEGRDDG